MSPQRRHTVWSTSTDLYAFGGRGFSIFQQNADGTIVKVEETGGDFEQILAALPNAGTVFNGENGGGFDSRSDNKGAEPEGVAVGTVDGTPYVFVALERIGGVMVWDVSTPADAKFVQYMPPTSDGFRARGHQVRRGRRKPDRPRHADHGQRDQRQRHDLRHRRSGDDQISAIQGSGHVFGDGRPDRHHRGRGHRRRHQRQPRLLHPGPQRRRRCRDVGRHLRVHQRCPDRDGRPACARHRRGRRVRGQRRRARQLFDHRDRGNDRGGRRDRRAGNRSGHRGHGDRRRRRPAAAAEQPRRASAFYESLEGMLVAVKEAVAVGPTNDFGEIYTVIDNDADRGNGVNGPS